MVSAPPSRVAEVGWLVRNGVPWVLKRSVDLVPALLVGAAASVVPPPVPPRA
ncbi:MAG TPA: hypothetical protein VES95_05295 [Dermatophilaceae bacterium]|nr:hypothetical protein [Dermatophilaceae bacterium]